VNGWKSARFNPYFRLARRSLPLRAEIAYSKTLVGSRIQFGVITLSRIHAKPVARFFSFQIYVSETAVEEGRLGLNRFGLSEAGQDDIGKQIAILAITIALRLLPPLRRRLRPSLL
jgi:hypothetical protein